MSELLRRIKIGAAVGVLITGSIAEVGQEINTRVYVGDLIAHPERYLGKPVATTGYSKDIPPNHVRTYKDGTIILGTQQQVHINPDEKSPSLTTQEDTKLTMKDPRVEQMLQLPTDKSMKRVEVKGVITKSIGNSGTFYLQVMGK